MCRAGLWVGSLIMAAGLVHCSPPPPARAALPNGLVLLHRENPASLTAAVSCFLRISALMETADSAGWRYLLQQTLLDLPDARGRRLEERLADDAIQISLQTSPDYVEVLLNGTANQLPDLLKHTREIFSDAQPEIRCINNRRRQVAREVANRRELPQTLAQDMAREALFRGSSCSWPVVGKASIGVIRPERLQELRRLHHGPNRAVVATSGPMTAAEAFRQAQAALGDLLPRPELAEPAATAVPARTGTVFYAPWESDNAVVLNAATFPGPSHREFAAAAVLGAVIGSGEGSRLFSVLRDQRGLAYDIHTDLAPSRLCGMIQIIVTCEPNQVSEVFRIMRDEISGLKTRPLTDAEVERAVAYLTGSYLLGHQRNIESAHYLGLFETLLPGQGAQSDLAAMFTQVTTAQAQAAAAWLHDRHVWVQVGGRPL